MCTHRQGTWLIHASLPAVQANTKAWSALYLPKEAEPRPTTRVELAQNSSRLRLAHVLPVANDDVIPLGAKLGSCFVWRLFKGSKQGPAKQAVPIRRMPDVERIAYPKLGRLDGAWDMAL